MLLYKIVLSIALFFVYPVALVGALFGKGDILRRLVAPKGLPEGGVRRVWIHAASVGEAGIAFSMAGEIKQKLPDSLVFVSTITRSGLNMIHKLNETGGSGIIDRAFLAPFDHPIQTRKFLKKIKPTSFILVETEIWPCLIQTLHNADIPITIINAKLSMKAFRQYMIIRFFVKGIVEKISLLCVQTNRFAKRYRLLGVPPERIEILGNIKFDGLPEPTDYNRNENRDILGLPADAKVFVAGSTRPGEEAILAVSFKTVLETYPNAIMVIAPRHLNRISEAIKAVEEAGLSYCTRSSGEKTADTGQNVLMLDTMGELMTAFSTADAAFVGGSLRDFNGHNPLEPAALGIPVLFGPYMEQTGSKELLNKGAAVLVHDEDELTEALLLIFEGADVSRKMAKAGPLVVKRFRGLLGRTLKYMKARCLI